MRDKAFFSAEIQQLSRMILWIRERLTKGGFDSKTIHRLELASEEVIVNVIHHAYAGGKGKIEIGLEIGPEQVKISIRDWGPPFDPLLNAPQVDPEASLDEREAGGLGIYLIRKIMDEVTYIREKDANLLTMIKHLY